MKLTILGGGGFRVPLVYSALLADDDRLIDRLCLYDTDPVRLRVVESVLAQMRAAHPSPKPVKVEVTTDLPTALTGADFVFSAIRVGGLESRIADERRALALGVLGQETVGPGGIAYALRSIPVALETARELNRCSPEAFVLNFTNPAGMITEAMRTELGHRVVGICDTPSGMIRRLATHFDVDDNRLTIDYVGLNHLGWLRHATVGQRDLVQELLQDDDGLAGFEEGRLFGVDWVRQLGTLPNEYLAYYYNNRDAVAAITRQQQTRGEYLAEQQDRFYRQVAQDPEQALARWQSARSEREDSYMREIRDGEDAGNEHGGGYEKVALDAMHAIARNERATMILNVANGSAIEALSSEAVVEVPCLVDAGGARPLAVRRPDPAQLGLMLQIKHVEQLTIQAATKRDSGLAWEALSLHPLVGSTTIARSLAERLIS
ncbi:6-phospho-beta-glucosidase [Streptomyces shenzhenensis]|uniref:6-phospho-beta-glucosidase n=1 Tax=Streptomyces shenzhenensis TaxID=943815 RepID=UPI00340E6E1C